MASFFRARRSDDGGNRGSRALQSSSNHLHPDGESGSGSWISGIVAGAGRLVSSVFKSESPSPSSYSYSSDEESSINSDEDDDTDVPSKEPDEPMTMEKKLETSKDCGATSLAIVSEIESKQAIEQLLMQETFSRDEGSQLIKLIESRVVEVGKDGMCKGLNSSTCNAMSSPGTWKSLNLSRKLPVSYSSSSVYAISPGSARVLTPQLRSSVVTEAKDFAVEGSPVDVAKSYMQALSPWRDKASRSFQFEKPPCADMHLHKDESPSATPTYHAPSSKQVSKRNHDAFGSRDTAVEVRKVRMKSTGDESDNSRFNLIDLSKRYSKDKACQMSSITDELIHNPNPPVRMGNTSSCVHISDTEETVKAVQSSHVHICDAATSISDGNQHIEAPWPVKSQLDSLSGQRSTSFSSPTSMDHDGSDRSETLLYHEAQKLTSIDINSPPSLVFSVLSDVEAGTRVDSVCTSVQVSHGVEYRPLGRDPIPCNNGIHPVAAADQDGNDQTQGQETGLMLPADGSPAGLNPSNTTNSRDGELAAIITERAHEPPSVDDTGVLAPKTTKTGRARAASRGGSRARAKSVKDAPAERKASTGRGRGGKSVPGARRGRGKQITLSD